MPQLLSEIVVGYRCRGWHARPDHTAHQELLNGNTRGSTLVPLKGHHHQPLDETIKADAQLAICLWPLIAVSRAPPVDRMA